jgi:thiosulfate dehydrogenase [quinone] large subunit
LPGVPKLSPYLSAYSLQPRVVLYVEYTLTTPSRLQYHSELSSRCSSLISTAWNSGHVRRVSFVMNIQHKSLAYALLRIAFGVNFAGHGLIRIYNGAGAFATSTAEHLAKSPIPHSFTFGFSYAIPFLEAVLGLTLILGVFTRIALVCGALFMMLLTIGVAANQQWDVAGQQLVYSVVFFLLLYLIEHNALALDNYLRSTRSRVSLQTDN